MTIRKAIEQSVNTVAYKLANQAGSDLFMSKLEKMQFSHLTPEDANPIIAIGGFTKGVTTVEMASGYSSFTRDGKFIEPTNIREIKDIVTKETIVKNKHEEVKVFQEDAAYFMIDTMKSVIKSGTGKSAALPNYSHVFGKTGTTNSNKDSYFVGGTPYYTTAVWIGYDMPATLASYELNLPKDLFRNWNTWLHAGKKNIDFQMPTSVYRSGNALYSRLESYSKQQAKREAIEAERLKKETAAQRERLALEDYRIIHNLTSEEEKKREKATEQAIANARNFKMTEVEQYEEWMDLIKKAEVLNEKVKHQRAKDAFTAQINELKVIAAVEKDKIIREIERQKEEERRREEQRKQEEAYIQSMQNELDGWMKRVESGEQLTQSEFEKLEDLVQRLENKGVAVPKLNIEWVEPEGTEEEPETESPNSNPINELVETEDQEEIQKPGDTKKPEDTKTQPKEPQTQVETPSDDETAQ